MPRHRRIVRRIDETVGALRIRSITAGALHGREAGSNRIDVELAVRPGAEERLHRGQCVSTALWA